LVLSCGKSILDKNKQKKFQKFHKFQLRHIAETFFNFQTKYPFFKNILGGTVGEMGF